MLKTLELRHNLNINGCLELVRLQSKEAVLVPAKQTVALCGKANISCLPDKEFLSRSDGSHGSGPCS